MAITIPDLELTIAIIRLFLIFLGILMCLEIRKRTAERFKLAVTYFMIALIPSIFYTVGRMLNIEATFTAGKLISLIFNTLTTAFIVLGLYETNKLVREITNPEIKTKKQGNVNKKNYRKLNKEIGIKNIIKRG